MLNKIEENEMNAKDAAKNTLYYQMPTCNKDSKTFYELVDEIMIEDKEALELLKNR